MSQPLNPAFAGAPTGSGRPSLATNATTRLSAYCKNFLSAKFPQNPGMLSYL